jgi:predicted TIM-barrel fold metal-dependent hydrolase
MICDSHCHFFSPGFFAALGREAGVDDASTALPAKLGWEPPGTDQTLADRWAAELQKNDVTRAMLIASVPGDEASVAAAVSAHPTRFVGAFMFNPAAPDADARLDRAFVELKLSTVCLFPAMHHVPVDDERTARVFQAAERHGKVVFVHCGVLSVGVRKKLNLPSRFDLRLGDPLGLAAVAVRHPRVTVIIPHFGAGFLREALMAADAAPNLVIDTSSSNNWVRFEQGATLKDTFARTLDCVGPSRILFGTDSSFFPRGWQRAIYDTQRAIWADLGVDSASQAQVFGGNFQRIWGQ